MLRGGHEVKGHFSRGNCVNKGIENGDLEAGKGRMNEH